MSRILDVMREKYTEVDELSSWGFGDVHYGVQSQEPRVARTVEHARSVLDDG